MKISLFLVELTENRGIYPAHLVTGFVKDTHFSPPHGEAGGSLSPTPLAVGVEAVRNRRFLPRCRL